MSICSNHNPPNPKPCGFIQPLTGNYSFDSETKEVFDQHGNMIGIGEPVWVNGEIMSIEVKPKQAE